MEQPIEITGVQPPDYNYEEAFRRAKLREENGGWRGTEHYPGSRKTLFAQTEDGSWTKVYFKTFDDGVIWQDGHAEDPGDAVRYVPKEEYYRNHVGTSVFHGEAVTRYVAGHEIKTRGGITTDPGQVQKWIADSDCFDAGEPSGAPDLETLPEEQLRIDEDVRLLHATRGWAYWSDDKMTPALGRSVQGDQTAEGNGQFTEATEDLLSKAWKGRGQSFERLENGKRSLLGVQEVSSTLLDSLHRRYGVMEFVSHNLALKKLTLLTGKKLKELYMLSKVYSGKAPDGFVDESYTFFEQESEAREAFYESYPARKVRRSRFGRKRKHFRERHSPLKKYFDEDGEEINTEETLFLPDDPFLEVRVNRPYVQRPRGAKEMLLFGLGHYVVTGERFGDGVASVVDGDIRVTIGINTGDFEDSLTREQESLKALRARLGELRDEPRDLDVEICDLDESRSQEDWHEIVVPRHQAYKLGKLLCEEPGPKGWGWTKDRLDECLRRGAGFLMTLEFESDQI